MVDINDDLSIKFNNKNELIIDSPKEQIIISEYREAKKIHNVLSDALPILKEQRKLAKQLEKDALIDQINKLQQKLNNFKEEDED